MSHRADEANGRVDLRVGPAVFSSGGLSASAWAFERLWLFWFAPLLGAAVGALVYEVVARPRAVAA